MLKCAIVQKILTEHYAMRINNGEILKLITIVENFNFFILFDLPKFILITN
jgi:hypothetical protein